MIGARRVRSDEDRWEFLKKLWELDKGNFPTFNHYVRNFNSYISEIPVKMEIVIDDTFYVCAAVGRDIHHGYVLDVIGTCSLGASVKTRRKAIERIKMYARYCGVNYITRSYHEGDSIRVTTKEV